MHVVNTSSKNPFAIPDSAKFHIFSFLKATNLLEKVSRQFKKDHCAYISDNISLKFHVIQTFGHMAVQAKTINTTWEQVYCICNRILLQKPSQVRLPLSILDKLPYIPADRYDSDSSDCDPWIGHDSSDDEPS